jgi:hypothetical protein
MWKGCSVSIPIASLLPTLKENIGPEKNKIDLEQEARGVPYCFLHLSNSTGIGAFVNSTATLPGGPGGGRYRREEIIKRTRVARIPARSSDEVSGVLLDMMIWKVTQSRHLATRLHRRS